ncbi:uncharacterized protein BO97DRAFT_408450 [Aspergillus homomorphus CBS 101889]|uniref:Uncharacterized protein n=1 Tax=Aspergillus homomorphus (strain CBS 101889) TaxID=1450537 RepID=A0A395HL74_ASPHC|nr:hypothetical protein BO97DRAFT_408450 [Aspergillus homomorphus CBS 101889]RAL08229.1 hypothetical protein BO97DRAFT_408450 [Aspergillus homomorphus CBS 101889]
MVVELVPYFDGMQQGQGYNTYTQDICVANAVTVKPDTPLPDTYDLYYQSDLVSDYKKLAQSLEISAGAAISGWGQSAKIDASYLNRAEFEASTVTYQVEVSSQQQGTIGNTYSFNKIKTDNPNETYGDRFITDFIKGGKFLARVSITSTSKSTSEEIKQSAEVAFSMYGATGKVTEEVKTAVQHINKNSRTRVRMHVSGGGGTTLFSAESDSDESGSQLYEIKKQADNFYQELKEGKHRYRRFAILWKYTNVPNFEGAFRPLDYTFASKKSWTLFEDFTRYGVVNDSIQKIPATKFNEGRTQQAALYTEGTNNEEAISNLVQAINKDPSKVNTVVPYPSPDKLEHKLLLSIKTVTMIAQERTLNNGSLTDIALPKLGPSAEKLFEFKAYDFENVFKTTVVSFGQKDDSYICLVGQRVSDYGYREESCFWVFLEQVSGVSEQRVVVSKLKSADLVRLSRQEPGTKFLFDFYA